MIAAPHEEADDGYRGDANAPPEALFSWTTVAVACGLAEWGPSVVVLAWLLGVVGAFEIGSFRR